MSNKAPRFLIVDGYPPESREQFNQVGMRLAGVLYADLLVKYLPEAEYDIWYSSDEGAVEPTDEQLSRYVAVIWPGCNLTIYHDDPRVYKHIRLCHRCYEAGIPQIGSCWGIQLANYVAGGKVEAHPKGREMGIATKIRLTEEGKKHPMFKGKPEVFSHLVSHDDYVTKLADGAILLAGNDWSPVQACEVHYKNGIFWATQYHPEYNLYEMARLIIAREQKLIQQGMFRDHEDLIVYVTRLEMVYQNPSLKYIRWQYKIDDDLIDDRIRECEFINWIETIVKPIIKSVQ
ncbi:MAG: gamma-glutamyl-gamma-aminobutyrate hydrolase family protein [Candidatus Hydrogenedentes bacterium]|nr:gamma-glutamyl-gamma-aminobutyrate hydrolase family protein [Candidatus Hydrogenedentota bacterium]